MSQKHLKWVQNYFNKLYQTPILENFLKLEIISLEAGKAVVRTKIMDKHCNLYGFIHGGTFASIADVVMGVACVTLGKQIVTIDMSTSYIKNAPQGSIITAIGQVISSGKTIVRAECEIFHEDQLLVKAHASYFITGKFDEEDHPPAEPR